MNIGEKIKAIRKSKGLSQKQLAENLNVSEAMISQYERGIKNPKIETVAKMADALEVTPFDIMGMAFFDATLPVEMIRNEVNAFDSVEIAFGSKSVELLNEFVQLNKTGQEKAIDYVSDLAEQPKYKK